MTLATERATLGPDDAVDLHMHTFASDGRWSPEELTGYLKEHGPSEQAFTFKRRFPQPG